MYWLLGDPKTQENEYGSPSRACHWCGNWACVTQSSTTIQCSLARVQAQNYLDEVVLVLLQFLATIPTASLCAIAVTRCMFGCRTTLEP